MKSRWLCAAIAGIFACIVLFAVTESFAGDATGAPTYRPAYAAAVSSSGYYVWLDGMYDRTRLPKYGLGFESVDFTTGMYSGPVETFDPVLNGSGMRGAVGYTLPGQHIRFELGGSYVEAKASSSQSNSLTTSELGLQFLNGALPNVIPCTGGLFTCAINGSLKTNYSSWQIDGKVASDWNYGPVMVTPSVTIFGGTSRNRQSLSQTFTQFDRGVPSNTGNYTADTSLRWTDIGARAGLDVGVPLTSALTVGFGGWLGVADRHTSLSGSDSENDQFNAFPGASTISMSANKGVFLANAEGGLTYSVTSMLTLRGFVGLNYDASVPGVAGPVFSGTAFAPGTVPASIVYVHETSYYAGGGAAVRF